MRPTSLAHVLFVALSLAAAPGRAQEGATPPTSAQPAPKAPEPLTAEVQAAVEQVAAASREADPAKAQAIARTASLVLAEAVAAGKADCWLVAVTAEAQLRGGKPADARATVARGIAMECDLAAMLQLQAWASELAPSGQRRGAGADLAKAEVLYMRAADLFKDRPGADDAFGSARWSASELARLRGADAACAERSLEALEILFPKGGSPLGDAGLRQRLGVTYLACEGHESGEGVAADRLLSLVPGDELHSMVNARLEALNDALDVGRDDAHVLAAVAFYGLLGGDEVFSLRAGKLLSEAEAIDPKLPDLWYLKGRANEVKGTLEEAKGDYRRQMADHPGVPASRLAANALALLIVEHETSPDALAEALRLVDAELKKTPNEAAMIDTRGQILVALGRRAEGIAALERAQALDPTDERSLLLKSLRQR